MRRLPQRLAFGKSLGRSDDYWIRDCHHNELRLAGSRLFSECRTPFWRQRHSVVQAHLQAHLQA